MSTDMRALLSEVAPRPTRRLDTRAIQRRGDRIRLARRVLALALALPLLGGLAWGADHFRWAGPGASTVPAGHLDMIADEPCEVPDVDFTLYLKDRATAREVNSLELRLRRMRHVVDVVYVDHHDAWVEFKTVYRDYPKFWRHLPVDALPASLRGAVDQPYNVTAVVHAIATPPVVEEVDASTKSPEDPCATLEGVDGGP